MNWTYRHTVAHTREWSDLRAVLGLNKVPDPSTLAVFHRDKLDDKKMEALLEHSIDDAHTRGVMKNPQTTAVDATGYKARHVSATSGGRSGRKMHDFPKVSGLIDIRSHLALPGRVEQALRRVTFTTLLADAGYDGQPQHDVLEQHGPVGLIPPTRARPAPACTAGGAGSRNPTANAGSARPVTRCSNACWARPSATAPPTIRAESADYAPSPSTSCSNRGRGRFSTEQVSINSSH
jgi:hypothetical protein